jgi:hypothetical protein
MRKIPPHISKYIDESIDRAMQTQRLHFTTDIDATRRELKADIDATRRELKADIDATRLQFKTDMDATRLQFKADMEHNTGALFEALRHEIRLIAEFTSSKPNREEVEDMIDEKFRQKGL